MAFIVAGIDSLVGIEQFQIVHRWVLTAHGNRPRIRDRRRICDLLRVIDRKTGERAVCVQRDEWLSIFVAAASGHEQYGAIVAGLGLFVIAHSRVRRHTDKRSAQRHAFRNMKNFVK